MKVMTEHYENTIKAKKCIDQNIKFGWTIAAMVADKYGILVVFQCG